MVGRSVPIPIPNKIAPFQWPKKQLQRQKNNEKWRTTDRQPYLVLRIRSTSDISSQSLPSLLNDNEYFDTQKSFVGWPWIATADTLASFSKSICRNWLASWISGIHAPLPWRRACAGSWILSRIDEAVMAASWIQKVCMPSELLQVDPMVENKRLFQSPYQETGKFSKTNGFPSLPFPSLPFPSLNGFPLELKEYYLPKKINRMWEDKFWTLRKQRKTLIVLLWWPCNKVKSEITSRRNQPQTFWYFKGGFRWIKCFF